MYIMKIYDDRKIKYLDRNRYIADISDICLLTITDRTNG